MSPDEKSKRLDSWKEIADYLGRDVRTAVRWEKEKGLPVRRLPGGKRQSVFAFSAEIDAWLVQQQETPLDAILPAEAGAEPNEAIEEAVSSPKSTAIVSASFWMSLGAGALAAVVLLGWFISTRTRESRALPAASASTHEVQLNTRAASLRFLRSEIETGVKPYRFAAADLNGDGKLDLVFSSSPGDVVGVLLGKGDATFYPARLNEGCPQADYIIVADFNRDGHPDIAATCTAGNFILVLWGKGDGTFPQRTEIPVPGGPRFLAGGDLNGDGWPDLGVSSFGEAALYVLMNHAGRFSARLLSRFEATFAVSIADLEGKGHAGLIASVRDHGKFGIALYQSKRDAPLELVRLSEGDEFAQAGAVFIEAADLDGDGVPDLLASLWNGQMWSCRGKGRGVFQKPAALLGVPNSDSWRYFVLVDLDLDGKRDLLLSDYRKNELSVFSMNEDGTFAANGALPIEGNPIWVVVADFDGDGLPDILSNGSAERPLMFKAAWKKPASR